MYTTPILLNGDMIASLTGSPFNQGNPGDWDFGIVLPGTQALAGAETTFRLVWETNVNTSDDRFQNGQGWRLEVYSGTGDPATDATGWSTVSGYRSLVPKNDLVSGLGAGDDYVVFEAEGGRFLLYDIRGGLPTSPATLTYLARNENGDPATGDNDGELDFGDSYAAYCFCEGTLIETDTGARAVEELRPGDRLLTLDSGLQPLRWVGRRHVTLADMIAHPALAPVRVAAGALGPGLPRRALWLSPQHRVLIRSPIVARMTGQPEALVAVKHLCGLTGIAQATAPAPVTYLHLRLDRHEVIRAEGAWAETLLIGRQALRAMSPDSRRELRLLFPELITETESVADAARLVLPGRVARKLALRHARNDRPLAVASEPQIGSISPSARFAWNAASHAAKRPSAMAARMPAISSW